MMQVHKLWFLSGEGTESRTQGTLGFSTVVPRGDHLSAGKSSQPLTLCPLALISAAGDSDGTRGGFVLESTAHTGNTRVATRGRSDECETVQRALPTARLLLHPTERHHQKPHFLLQSFSSCHPGLGEIWIGEWPSWAMSSSSGKHREASWAQHARCTEMREDQQLC